MSNTPRVRFAPSPTGFLHVGGARTALFNWLFVRRSGGSFILRIEDTDRARSDEAMTRAIVDGLEWLGLDWDEGPYHQADRLALHQAAADRLLAEGKAYRCFATPDELRQRREGESEDDYRLRREDLELSEEEAQQRIDAGEPFTIRFKVPEGTTEWVDGVHGPMRFANRDIDDFIILRSDRTPVYNLAAVVDDADMRITHVIRGDDHTSNTPRQIMLYEALGAAVPTFVHVPMILGPDGKRLSKRHGATAVGEYAGEGILPQALVNFLALLGWSPGDDREIMELPELVESFSLERILKKSGVFDPDKLVWMNGQYMARVPARELVPLIREIVLDRGLASQEELTGREDWLEALVALLQRRSRLLTEVVDEMQPFFSGRVEYDPAALEKHWKDPELAVRRLAAAEEALRSLPEWGPEEIERALRSTAERLGTGFGKVVHPLRLALTGSAASPGIDQVAYMMGRDLCLIRILEARNALAAMAT